jgi:hypothetical protein
MSLVLVVIVAAVGLLISQDATGNPGHFADDYVIYARANAEGITEDRKAYEPDCDGSNHGQAQTSGQTNTFYGRIHSYADMQLTGANTYADTLSSPNPRDHVWRQRQRASA